MKRSQDSHPAAPPQRDATLPVLGHRDLRVVIVAPPNTHTDRWRSFCSANGWEVYWIAYAWDHDEAVATIPEVKGRYAWQTVAAISWQTWRVRRLLRQLGPDLVHAHWLTGPGWLVALSRVRPFIATAWGSDALRFTRPSLLGRMLARLVGRSAVALTYDSDSIANALAGVGVSPNRMRRLVFGADPELFAPVLPDKSLLRSLGIDNDDPVVLSPRGVTDVYDPETVLRGFALALERVPCNLLLRIGAHESEQWVDLERLVEDLGVGDRVISYTDLPRAELATLFCSSAVVVSIPTSDGTSVSLLEALFCERPVIVSDLEANREWIPDREFGWIVQVGDAQAVGAAIVNLLEHPEDSRARAKAAAARAREFGNAQIEFARAKELYLATVRASG